MECEMNSRNLKKIFMCRYVDIIYYIFIYNKEAIRSFGLEGNPAGLMSSSSSLPPSPVLGPEVTPLSYGVSSFLWKDFKDGNRVLPGMSSFPGLKNVCEYCRVWQVTKAAVAFLLSETWCSVTLLAVLITLRSIANKVNLTLVFLLCFGNLCFTLSLSPCNAPPLHTHTHLKKVLA